MNSQSPSQGTLFESSTITNLSAKNPIDENCKAREVLLKNQTKNLPPMLQHYLEVKSEYSDRLVFYQVGDFFEVFFDDAQIVSDCLSIRLTSRDKDKENAIPMCGVPIHAFSSYSKKLTDAGFGCVIVEQVEASSEAKGLVKREVTRILTPGISFEAEGEETNDINYIMSIVHEDEPNRYSVSILNASTGRVFIHDMVSDDNILGVISRYAPREIVLHQEGEELKSSSLKEKLQALLVGLFNFKIKFTTYKVNFCLLEDALTNIILGEELSLDFTKRIGQLTQKSLECLLLIIDYTLFISRSDKILLSKIDLASQANGIFSEGLSLDGATIRNLELLSSYDGNREFSLVGVLDSARTAIGSRQIRDWIISPSADIIQINQRLDIVSSLIQNDEILSGIRKLLYEIRDLERICTKLISGRISPYDLGLLLQSLKVVPAVRLLVQNLQSENELSKKLVLGLKDLSLLTDLLESSLLENLPNRVGDGPIFKDSYHEELKRLRNIETGAKKIIAELETREKNTTGISSLKIKHNSVLGYFVEVSANSSSKVPNAYIKKQELSNVERYFTEELKTLEKEIFSASTKIDLLEKNLFSDLKKECIKFVTQIQMIAANIGVVDALCSFATISINNDYVRPVVRNDLRTEIKQGRHPVVEKAIGRVRFVANDTLLFNDIQSSSGSYFSILTGPNMGGKSTYLRQVGVIQLMAQIGCYVPAVEAKLGIVDQIFTRIGAGDSLAKGDSTFMVEMKEAAKIVSLASEKSLVLIDELGRGTATNDGFSIALAVSEWLIKRIKCRTIFATHFHELTQLDSEYEEVNSLRVGIIETTSKIEFTHQIENLPAEKSYGIHVAKLAGLPYEILKRANEIALNIGIELKISDCKFDANIAACDERRYSESKDFIKMVSQIDPDSLSARDSLKLLYDVVEKARNVKDELS